MCAEYRSLNMKKIIFIFGLLVDFLPVFSQKLALKDAINIALRNSLEIQVYRQLLDIASISNFIGMAGGLPFVTGSATDNFAFNGVNQKFNTGQVIKRNGAEANNLSANITGSILLYNGSRVMATKGRLQILEKQGQDFLNAAIQTLMATVMTSYYDIIRQQGYTKTLELAIVVARKKLEIVQTQQGVGLANNADLFQAQVDLNNLVQSEQSQLLVVNQAKADLLRLMTSRPDSTIIIEDTIDVDRNILLEDVLNRVPANPDVLAADDLIRINQQIIKEVSAQRYPSLKGNLGYTYSGNNASAGQLLLNQSYGPFVGLGLIVPIYNGSVYKRQQKIANLNTNIAAFQKDMLVRDYRANVIKTFQAYSTTLQQLEGQTKNYQLAQQLLQLVIQRFQFRQATIIDVTQAQQSFVTASFSLVNYSFVAKSAEIELKRVASQLTF